MHIASLRIRHFRTIDDLSVGLGKLAAICGPNSCGKSNLFRAIQFALSPDPSKEEIYRNLPFTLRDASGGPRLSIWVDVEFTECPRSLAQFAGKPRSDTLRYSFRAMRSGTVTRKLEGVTLTDVSELTRHFSVVFVPPIRDLLAGGMEPFKDILTATIRRSRGAGGLHAITGKVREALGDKATVVLGKHRDLAQKILHADGIGISTASVALDGLLQDLSLVVQKNGEEVALEDMGTGHQSTVIMSLYRQFGEETPGTTLYLFEEPDNHLHPATIRAMGTELERISHSSQVLVTSHSPILLNHFGYDHIVGLHSDGDGISKLRSIDVASYTAKQIQVLLNRYGIRATEPLFCQRVIVVEGVSDATLFNELLQIRSSLSPDHLECLVLPAGGKEAVVELCKLLNRLDVDWRAVLDWDACLEEEYPRTLDGLDSSLVAEAIEASDKLLGTLDTSTRRGRNLRKTLEALRNEFEGARPTPTVLDGSKLDRLLSECGGITASDRAVLKNSLTSRRKRTYRDLLAQQRVWVWSGAVEDAIIQSDECAAIAVDALRDTGFTAPANREQLINFLHNNSNTPGLLQTVVGALESEGKFGRTEVNLAYSFLFDDLLC